MSKFLRYSVILLLIIIISINYDIMLAQKKSSFLELAKKLYDNGDYKQAIDFIDKALDKDTQNLYQAYNLRGICNYNLKQYFQALSDLNKSINLINIKLSISEKSDVKKELNTLLSNTYFNRALVFQELNELDSALNDYSYVINSDKDNKYAYFNKGFIYYQQSVNDSAVFYFTKVLQIDSNDLDALYNRANIYYQEGNCQLSEIDYHKLITNKREDEYIYFNLGNCQFSQGNYLQSIEYYNKSIKNNKYMLSSYYNRAQSYKSIKNYTAAVNDLKFVLDNIQKDINFASKKEEISKELINLQNFMKEQK